MFVGAGKQMICPAIPPFPPLRALFLVGSLFSLFLFQGCSEKTASRIPVLSLPPSSGFRIVQPLPPAPSGNQDSNSKKSEYIGLLFSIARPDPGHVIAVGAQSIIWRIDEASGKWKKVPSPVKSEFYRVIFPDPRHGWIAGDSGTLLFSQDEGMSWSVVPTPVHDRFLEDIDFPDPLHGFIVGERGTFLKTRDGGHSWSKISLPTTQNLYAVHFLDRREGWVAGWHQTLFSTHDGGRTWSPVTLAVPRVTRQKPSFNAIWGNQKDLLVAGDHGLVYFSSDKGESFQRISLPVETDLYGVCQTGSGTIILVGEKGALWSLDEKGKKIRSVLPSFPEADFLGVSCGALHFRAAGSPDVILLPG
ncbi:MAG: YCF48-related protein [Nitrospiraceae bacterium]|nr:YCF48-related protein [Bacillota bacterium]MDA8150869.1 YCF48-related protein [Nitrospiraceae bacterium]